MKKIFTLALLAITMGAYAEEPTTVLSETTTETTAEAEQEKKSTIEIPQWVKNIKISGYGMLQYQGSDQEGSKNNAFNLRLLRLIVDGKIGDFDWRAQIQGTSNAGPGNPTVMLVDLYAEWVKYKYFRVRAGQFKRAFTFENPTNPITQGWYAYADVVNRLSAFGDRTGEKASGGRDIGIQIQGDFLKNANGRELLHYQVGVYNGEGINQKDKDNKKDIIGGLWVMPIKGLRIGAFGWTGTRGDMLIGTFTDDKGNTINNSSSVRKNRYALSVEYSTGEYMFRSEYIHSQGWGAASAGNNVREVDYSKGDKADGWYIFGIVPVVKSKLHAKARYQAYRDTKEWNRMKTMYEVGLNYFFCKNLQLNFEYARVNDRTATKHNYNFVDLELDFRF